MPAPVNGKATLTGTIDKPFATSDEVRFVVTHRGTPVFQRIFAPGETGARL